jgi:Rrf2 family cysteine metabolism transcriptional repressor
VTSMKLSTKGEYAARAVLDLSLNYGQRPVKIREIAERQDISQKYLETILLTLQRAGVVRSKRGARGGYYLARPPEAISVGEVIRAMDGPLAPIGCVSVTAHEFCPREATCGLKLVWREARDAVANILDHTTFADVCQKDRETRGE